MEDQQPYEAFTPQNLTQANSAPQNGFYSTNSYAQDMQMPSAPPPNFYGNSHYNPETTSPPQSAQSFAPNYSHSASSPTRVNPIPISHPVSDFSNVGAQPQGAFFNVPQQQYQHPQPMQQPQPQSQPQTQPQIPGMQSAMPFMMAGLQQMSGAGGNAINADLGKQLFHSLAPGAAGYTSQFFGEGQNSVQSFLRLPKYYFAVNHRYVLKKLSLILMPFTNRTWARRRGMDPAQFDGNASDSAMSIYLPPREDVNAPDLYIPVVAFWTYVMMVGFVFGVRDEFTAEVLARYISKGFGVLALEVFIIKIGLYLINARYTPLLDVIAYRGYKFVGVVLTMATGLIARRVYWFVMVYSAAAMAIFLMRSHRRIILPRDVDVQQAQDLAKRNGFLLFLSVLQFPIYWLLVLDVRS